MRDANGDAQVYVGWWGLRLVQFQVKDLRTYSLLTGGTAEGKRDPDAHWYCSNLQRVRFPCCGQGQQGPVAASIEFNAGTGTGRTGISSLGIADGKASLVVTHVYRLSTGLCRRTRYSDQSNGTCRLAVLGITRWPTKSKPSQDRTRATRVAGG